MDNRVLMWLAVAMIWLLVYQAWQRDYAPRPEPAAVETVETPQIPVMDAPPQLTDNRADAPPPAPTLSDSSDAAPDLGRYLTVTTDVYDLAIDLTGGNLVNVVLLDYPVAKEVPDVKVELLNATAQNTTALQTGLLAAQGMPSPTHDAQYSATRNEYTLGDGDDQMQATLRWSQGDIEVDKIYTFYRGRYNILLEYKVRNQSGTTWSGAQYAQLKGVGGPAKRSMTDVDSYSFRGAVVYDGESYEKYDAKDLTKNPIDTQATGGWIANIQHHFLAAAIPPAEDLISLKSRTPDERTTLISGVGPLYSIANGAEYVFAQQFFVGPKVQSQMEETAPGLRLSVDYGMLTIIAQPMFWLLDTIHTYTGNWGWAIILLTILIKLLFYPLAQKAGRSSAKMRAVAPRLKSIQERYKDDKQAQSKAMMELYKKEKINPASGCLPLLIQMPVFLALYWVLIESVELRQAPFMGWIQDLSSRDPYFVLPVIMAGAMYVQTKLNPAPPDPTMAKVMTFMPIVMSIFFMFFPAGLVLYWVVNTVLSVAQQWRINKVVGATS